LKKQGKKKKSMLAEYSIERIIEMKSGLARKKLDLKKKRRRGFY
jgi:hypothetical protein